MGISDFCSGKIIVVGKKLGTGLFCEHPASGDIVSLEVGFKGFYQGAFIVLWQIQDRNRYFWMGQRASARLHFSDHSWQMPCLVG